jgi:Mg2+-importing ATPase
MARTLTRARPQAAPAGLEAYWSLPLPELLDRLGASTSGLTSEEAESRFLASGAVAPRHRRTQLIILLRQFATPVTLILVVATLLSAALGETVDAGIILAIVLLSGMLSFWQEASASRAMAELLRTVQVLVDVKRDGAVTQVPAHRVVPGDVVLLDTGDMVPGDCRILEANGVLADEAPLTGESFPVEKEAGVLPPDTAVGERSNCLFQGTHVVRGNAAAVVVLVGAATEFGRAAQRLEQQAPPTSFERGIRAFGGLLLRVMVVLVGLIFAFNVLLGRPLIDSFLFSLALAVGLTPQLLPAIVSISLSLGARTMARARVIVKRLAAIEDFGAMDVLCTDKTGTLTLGRVELAKAVPAAACPEARLLHFAAVNASLQSGYTNPIDEAIIAKLGRAEGESLGELPYDFSRKRLSVLVRAGDGAVLVTKGAVEGVLAVCGWVEGDGGRKMPLSDYEAEVRRTFEDLSRSGFRALGLAVKEVRPDKRPVLEDEADMLFLGLLAFADPTKPDIGQTVREIEGLGISLRMITGDNRLVAASVARTVGLAAGRVVTGNEVAALSDADLAEAIGDVPVFAEVDPVQKERIVRALRRAGHTVGFLGDGINDAPALHAADVGISVDNAADVAKDSASIVLLDKDLQVLAQGVRLGRRTFANTLKYVFVAASSNFGNMASMAGAALILPFLPMLPMQILLLNFLSDLPATTISSDDVDPEQVQEPEAWNIHDIRDFMVLFGPISSVFDFLTFGLLRLAFGAAEGVFRSGWFLESLATQLTVILVLRTRRRFYRSRPSSLLMAGTALTGLAGLALVLTPLGDPLGFVPVPAAMLAALAAVLFGYVIATEAGKAWYYRSRRR